MCTARRAEGAGLLYGVGRGGRDGDGADDRLARPRPPPRAPGHRGGRGGARRSRLAGPAGSLWLAAALLAIAGGGDSVSAVCRSAINQSVTPDHLRGRMSSVFSLVVPAARASATSRRAPWPRSRPALLGRLGRRGLPGRDRDRRARVPGARPLRRRSPRRPPEARARRGPTRASARDARVTSRRDGEGEPHHLRVLVADERQRYLEPVAAAVSDLGTRLIAHECRDRQGRRGHARAPPRPRDRRAARGHRSRASIRQRDRRRGDVPGDRTGRRCSRDFVAEAASRGVFAYIDSTEETSYRPRSTLPSSATRAPRSAEGLRPPKPASSARRACYGAPRAERPRGVRAPALPRRAARGGPLIESSTRPVSDGNPP